jgi:starch-binding outer membrane protein, SusD/RagB family
MKKMKYIYNSLLVCLTLGLFGGCQDYLDREPLSDISPANYLLDESHLAAYTAARYGIIRSNVGNGSEMLYSDDQATDCMTTRGSNIRFTPGTWTVGSTGGRWVFDWIYQLNYFIGVAVPRYEAGLITGNQDNVKHYIGEAYFFRAYEYFNKLDSLGDFPIITTVLPDNKDTLIEHSKRRPRNEVARFILSDLDKAIAMCSNSPVGGTNRITKDLAYLFKSRVALFEATWLKYHKGTALVPNGPGWPGANKAYNANYQYPSGSIDNEINYFLDQAMAAAKVVADAHALVTNSKSIQQSASQPANPYYDMFASQASLSGNTEVLLWKDFDMSLGIMHYWNHYLWGGGGYGYTRQFVDCFLMQNGLPIYAEGSGYAGDDYVQNVKIDRDWRLRLFMKAPGEVKAFQNVVGTPEVEATVPEVDGNDKTLAATGYSIKKGLSLDVNMKELGKDLTNIVCFRAAEAYLNYIEASWLRNGVIDSDADKYWRAIRTRAGIDPDYNKTINATNMSKEAENNWAAYSHGVLVDATTYNIRRERGCEFIAEGLRYRDLKRWRSMDQLNGFKIEGIKIWGPMKDIYGTRLVYNQATISKNTASDPALSIYLRVHQIATNSPYYNGYFWTEAHYLEPIAANHFLDSSSDGVDVTTSPIYQNPGWTTIAGTVPTSK